VVNYLIDSGVYTTQVESAKISFFSGDAGRRNELKVLLLITILNDESSYLNSTPAFKFFFLSTDYLI
jgi:hypothetical protein